VGADAMTRRATTGAAMLTSAQVSARRPSGERASGDLGQYRPGAGGGIGMVGEEASQR
jgi:hypothetical protein